MIIVSVYKLRSERLAFRARTLRDFRIRWNAARARWFEQLIEVELDDADAVVPSAGPILLTRLGLSKILGMLEHVGSGLVLDHAGRAVVLCADGALRRLDGGFGPDASPDDSVEVRP